MSPPDAGPPRRPPGRFILGAGVAVVVAFLAGFGWQFLEARSARAERDALRTELAFQELATTLASATIQAEYGSYDGARELMSRFYTGLQEHREEAPAEAMQELGRILESRDAVITSLSRAEEGSRATLARLFVRYQSIFGGPDRALPLPPPRDTPAGDTPVATDTLEAPDTLDLPE